MQDDSRARNTIPPPALAGADYDAIFATVAATERGRWFLDEYLDRHRGADTRLILTAIERVETAVHAGHPAQQDKAGVPASVQQDLAAAIAALSRVRQEVGYDVTAADLADSAGPLPRLIDEIDWHLQSLAEALLPAQQTTDAFVSPPVAEPAQEPPTSLDDMTSNKPADLTAPHFETATDTLEPFAEFAVLPDEMPIEAPPALAGLAAASSAEVGPAAESDSEASIADWAFASPDAEPSRPETSASERLPPGDLDVAEPSLRESPLHEPTRERAALSDTAMPSNRPLIDWTAAALSQQTDASITPPRETAAPAPTEPPLSTLEGLEAREYGRSVKQEPRSGTPIDDIIAPPERLDRIPLRTALDELIESEPARATGTLDEPSRQPVFAPQSSAIDSLIAEPREPQPLAAAEPMFDSDLFDSERQPDASTPREPEQVPWDGRKLPPAASLPRPPSPLFDDRMDDLSEPEPPRSSAAASTPRGLPPLTATDDQPAVIERLDHMRRSIAALMDEIAQKTGRPVNPPRS